MSIFSNNFTFGMNALMFNMCEIFVAHRIMSMCTRPSFNFWNFSAPNSLQYSNMTQMFDFEPGLNEDTYISSNNNEFNYTQDFGQSASTPTYEFNFNNIKKTEITWPDYDSKSKTNTNTNTKTNTNTNVDSSARTAGRIEIPNFDYSIFGKNAEKVKLLRPEMQRKVRQMYEYAKSKGWSIHISDGFRSSAQQAKAYKDWLEGRKKAPTVAPPGKSRHEFGCAVDISISGGGDDAIIEMGKYAVNVLGMGWGGNWSPAKRETWHFELDPSKVSMYL